MTTTRVNMGRITAGELKEFLKDVPNDVEVDVENVGETGFVDGVVFELITFEGEEKPMLTLEIKAEGGFY